MSLRRKKTVACPKCNKESDYLFWESLNGDLDPEAKTQLIDGTFFQFKCPHCGHECKVDYGMLYHDMAHQTMIYYVSENSVNSVYTRTSQNSTANSNATNLHCSQKRCCSFCISSSNASPTFQVQKSIFHQMTKPIQVTVILPLLLAISFSRNDDIHSSISGISNDLIGVIPTIGQ